MAGFIEPDPLKSDGSPDILPSRSTRGINPFGSAVGNPNPLEQQVDVARSTSPEIFSQEQVLLDAYKYEQSQNSIMTNVLDGSMNMYNSIAAAMNIGDGQEAYNFTDEEVQEEDDSFNIRNHPELQTGLPLYYRREMSSARNYKHALTMRYRMLTRVQDTQMLQEAGLGYQLVGGLVASGLDPLSWLGGGLVGVLGKTALRASQVKRLHEAVLQGGRLTRIGYAGVRGSAYGIGGAGAQFGTMSLYDSSVNAAVVEKELIAGGVGGAIIPVGVGAIGGVLSGFTDSRLVRADLFDDFVGPRREDRIGPVGRALQFTGGFGKSVIDRGTNIPGWIGGKNPYQIHQRHNPESAGQLYESGRGPVDGSTKINSAELDQAIQLRKLLTRTDYNGFLEEFIGTKVKSWRKFKKSKALWTHSDLKKEFEAEVFPLLYRLEEGSALPDTTTMTGAVKDSQIVLNAAATRFHETYKTSMEQMAYPEGVGRPDVSELVAGSRELYDAGIYIPKTINEYNVHHLVNNRGERAVADELERTGKTFLTEAEILRTKDLARKSVIEDIRKIISKGIKADIEARGDTTTLGKLTKDLEEMLGVELHQTDVSRLHRSIVNGLAEGTINAGLRASRQQDFDPLPALREAVHESVSKTLTRPIARGDDEFIDSTFARPMLDLIVDTVVRAETPYNTTLLHKYLRTNENNVATVASGPDRFDLNLFKTLLDDDLFGTIMSTMRERTGQSAISKTVEIPNALGNNIPGRTINSHAEWEQATALWKNKGAEAGQQYPENFFEDTWRHFMGEPTRHMVTRGLGSTGRRLTTAAYQSTLGLGGFAQASDISNILARGWHGKLAAVEALPHTVLSWIGQEYRLKGNVAFGEMETLLGDISNQFRYQRGDFYKADFMTRDKGFLHDVMSPSKWFDVNNIGKWARQGGDTVDNVQAYSDRALGAISGMNVATQYLAVAGQKSLLREFDVFMKKITTNDFSKTDIGFMRQLGITRADLHRLKGTWDAHITRGMFGGIQKLDIDEWDPIELAWFTNIMERGMGFMMGTATRGELPRRLDNPFIAAILQIRRYSMGAHEKALMGGMNIGAGHMFHHTGLAMGVGMTAVLLREFVKAGPEGVEDLLNQDQGVIFRRALSSAPTAGVTLDSSSMVVAPLLSFFDSDWANAMHFGYNRYDKGPARGGLDAIMEQIPVYKFTKDGLKAGQDYFTNYDDSDSLSIFAYDLMKIMPAPLGNAMGSIVLNNMFELDKDNMWE